MNKKGAEKLLFKYGIELILVGIITLSFLNVKAQIESTHDLENYFLAEDLAKTIETMAIAQSHTEVELKMPKDVEVQIEQEKGVCRVMVKDTKKDVSYIHQCGIGNYRKVIAIKEKKEGEQTILVLKNE